MSRVKRLTKIGLVTTIKPPMPYLSQLLGRKVYFKNKLFGRIEDMAILNSGAQPPISKIEIRNGNKKITIPPQALAFEGKIIYLITPDIPQLPFDHADFYLAEDLLDKQIIDINGKRIVRVNDIAIERNGEFKVTGIDIGFDGILRRIGLSKLSVHQEILPWRFIEAFDYDTGNVKIKLTENKLSDLHPSEIVDILEDVGNNERLGILSTLDDNKAAMVIEEADEETQLSILESLAPLKLKNIINKIHVRELANVFNYIHPLRSESIRGALDKDRLQRIKTLSSFPAGVAGSMMHAVFQSADSSLTVNQLLEKLSEIKPTPETIIVTNGNSKIVGILYTKDLMYVDGLALLKDIVVDKKFIFTSTPFASVLRLFSRYNLRIIPIIDNAKKPIGVISIDDVLKTIEEEKERNATI